MTGAFSRAIPTQVVKLNGELSQRGWYEDFVSIGYRHLRHRPTSRPPLLRRTFYSTSVPLGPCVEARVLSPPQEWVGLPAWRTNPLNELRVWGKRGPTSFSGDVDEIVSVAGKVSTADVLQMHGERLQRVEAATEKLIAKSRDTSLAEWGAVVLGTADPVEKAFITHHAYRLWCNGELPLGVADPPVSPARPDKPELVRHGAFFPRLLSTFSEEVYTLFQVHPRKIPPPNATSLTPSAHAFHNLAHIELNAIDLAWDTLVRFSRASDELDRQFYADFAHVAHDESRHCLWCLQRLAEMGFRYGDMPAHNLLLRDCEKSSGNVMARLAIIPMMQEARGLDAGPRLFDRLTGNGDNRSADIAKRIAEEEVGHVAVGVAWFVEVCRRLGVNPANRFQDLLKESDIELRGPFNHSARLLAGLPRDWYDSMYDPCSPVVNSSETANQRGPKVVKVSRERSMQVTQKVSRGSEPGEDHRVDAGFNRRKSSSRLPEVSERLAMVVAMEHENADA